MEYKYKTDARLLSPSLLCHRYKKEDLVDMVMYLRGIRQTYSDENKKQISDKLLYFKDSIERTIEGLK